MRALKWAWLESEADFGSRCYDSLARYDQCTSSWKTLTAFGDAGPTLSSEERPLSGMTAGGVLYPLRPSERGKEEDDSGSYLPTLCARDYRTMARSSQRKDFGSTLVQYLSANLGRRRIYLSPTWAEGYMGYPEGWTELKDSVMQWFRKRRAKPSSDLAG
jgi:hypothetical protein